MRGVYTGIMTAALVLLCGLVACAASEWSVAAVACEALADVGAAAAAAAAFCDCCRWSSDETRSVGSRWA